MFDYIHTFSAAIGAMPIDHVSSSSMASSHGASHSMDVSMIGLFLQADMIVKSVMIMLIIASIWCWSIIFDKLVGLNAIKIKHKSFEKNFWAGQSLENMYERVRGRENHPMAQVFNAAMIEWQARNVIDLNENKELRAGTKERIAQTMSVATNKAIDEMENNLSFLATVGSSAPFVGLFGTVWGIMVSFQSIAASKNTTLAVVAPGIAEALLATAFGLVAAIPAVIFYNKFSNDINRIANNLDDFASELSAIITKEIDKMGR